MKRSDFIKLMGIGVGSYAYLPSITSHSNAATTSSLPTSYKKKACFVNDGPGFGNRLCLTYDDGPTPGVTDRILADLQKRKIKATFFVIGKKLHPFGSLAKEVADEGHEIANHTYNHLQLARLSSKKVEDEIHRTQEIIFKVTGQVPVWFRPPYGSFRRNQGPIPRSENLGVAYWSVDPRDWQAPGVQTIVRRVVKQSRPGSIVLLHDLKKQTADANPYLLDKLQAKAFNFCTMSAFLGNPYPETESDTAPESSDSPDSGLNQNSDSVAPSSVKTTNSSQLPRATQKETPPSPVKQKKQPSSSSPSNQENSTPPLEEENTSSRFKHLRSKG